MYGLVTVLGLLQDDTDLLHRLMPSDQDTGGILVAISTGVVVAIATSLIFYLRRK